MNNVTNDLLFDANSHDVSQLVLEGPEKSQLALQGPDKSSDTSGLTSYFGKKKLINYHPNIIANYHKWDKFDEASDEKNLSQKQSQIFLKNNYVKTLQTIPAKIKAYQKQVISTQKLNESMSRLKAELGTDHGLLQAAVSVRLPREERAKHLELESDKNRLDQLIKEAEDATRVSLKPSNLIAVNRVQ